jgi:N-acetylglucosamine-6-sulfatase
VSDKPDWVRFIASITTPAGNVQRDVLRQHQLETLLAVDEAVDALLARLETLGLTDDTLVVFTSDNGYMWGEHWWWSKWAAYEESIRVPLVIRWPTRVPAEGSRPQLALNIDLAPTFAEAARVAIPPTVDGQSLLPVLDGTGTTWREDFVTEAWGALVVPPYVALRTTRWKLIRNRVTSGIADELYDLSIDPYELDNLASDARFAEIHATLSTRLDALLAAPPGGPFAPLARAAPPPDGGPLGGSGDDELLGDLRAAGIELP